MAKGRMIVKDIGTDERLWGLSDRAKMLFPYCLPHIETDGTLPRKTISLKFTCFPLCDATKEQVESVILEWIASGLCVEKGDRLFFTDFEKSNENLDFLRKRIKRENVRKCPDNTGKSGTFRNVHGSEVKGSEVKRREVKGIKKKQQRTLSPQPSVSASAIAENDAENPEVGVKTTEACRETTPLQRVVNAYKESLGVGMEDKAWDRANYARYSKAAKSLLDCFGGWEKAAVYVIGKGQEWGDLGISWTLETVARHAWDNRGKINERAPAEVGHVAIPGKNGHSGIAGSGIAARSAKEIMASGVLIPPRRLIGQESSNPVLDGSEDGFIREDQSAGSLSQEDLSDLDE